MTWVSISRFGEGALIRSCSRDLQLQNEVGSRVAGAGLLMRNGTRNGQINLWFSRKHFHLNRLWEGQLVFITYQMAVTMLNALHEISHGVLSAAGRPQARRGSPSISRPERGRRSPVTKLITDGIKPPSP